MKHQSRFVKQFWIFLISFVWVHFSYTQKVDTSIETEIKALIDSSQFYLKGNPRYSQYFLNKALLQTQGYSNSRLLSKIHNNYGISYYYLGVLDSCILHYKKSLKFAKEAKSPNEIAIRLKNLGLAYRKKSLYGQAIDHYQQSLEINKSYPDSHERASIYNSIGNIYHLINSYEKAIEFHKKALHIWSGLQDSLRCSRSYNNQGIAYQGIGEYEKAIMLYKKSLLYNPGNDNALKNMGENLLRINQLDSGYMYLNLAYKLRLEKGSKKEIASVFNQLAEFYRKKGDYKLAHKHLDSSQNVLKTIEDQSVILDNYRIRKKILAAEGNYKEALTYEEHITKIDSILFKKQKLEVLERESYYTLATKEKEKLLLEKENKIITIQQEKQSTFLRNALLIILLLVFVVIILWYAFKAIKTKNDKLKDLNQIISHQKAEISHRNKNGLMRVIALIRNMIRTSEDEVTKKYLERVETMVFSLSSLESFLYFHKMDNEQIAIKPFFEKLISDIDSSFRLPNQQIKYRVDIQEIVLSSYQLSIVSLVLVELFLNSYKHAAFKDNIGEISLIIKKDIKYQLLYRDNGVEFNIEQSKWGGIGIIENMIKYLKGEIEIIKDKDIGTSFICSFN